MPEEAFEDFHNIPWCKSLFTNPSYIQIQHPHRLPTSSSPTTTKQSLLAGPLFTTKTIRACAAFYKRQPPETQRPLSSEFIMLYSLGPDLGAHAGICHGGFFGILFDEVNAALVYNIWKKYQIFTKELKVEYVKPLFTPNIVKARAWIEREPVGRKVWVKCLLEDGEGAVYARGESFFVRAAEGKL